MDDCYIVDQVVVKKEILDQYMEYDMESDSASDESNAFDPEMVDPLEDNPDPAKNDYQSDAYHTQNYSYSQQCAPMNLQYHSVAIESYRCDNVATNSSEDDDQPTQQYITANNLKKSIITKYMSTSKTASALHSCKLCSNVFSSSNALERHKKTHVKTFTCKFCSKAYLSKDNLKMHYNTNHINDLLMKNEGIVHNISTYTCDKCNHVFSSMFSLTEHSSQCFKCRSCVHTFVSPNALRNHENRVHKLSDMQNTTLQKEFKNPEEKFPCLYCGASMIKRCLVTHIRKKHPDEVNPELILENLPYSCEFCNYRCKLKSSLKVHNATHSKIKPFLCGIDGCEHRAVLSNSIKLHRLTHDLEKNTLSCEYCTFRTVNKYIFKMHQKSHSLGDLMKLECGLCEYTTWSPVNMEHHKFKHSDVKEFKCENCDFATKYPTALKKHMKSQHCNS